jgi:hypothetical protein
VPFEAPQWSPKQVRLVSHVGRGAYVNWPALRVLTSCSVSLLFGQGSDFWLTLAVAVEHSVGSPRTRIRVVYVASDASKAVIFPTNSMTTWYARCPLTVTALSFFVLQLFDKLANLFSVRTIHGSVVCFAKEARNVSASHFNI